MYKKRFFIVLEGPDKSGKSTQAKLLARALRKQGFSLLHTREPGGTPLAEAIRRILLDPKIRMDSLSELFLYEASRAEHTLKKILPALKKGKVVLSERYALATLAYQGYARGIPRKIIDSLNRIATLGLWPDLTFVLDVPEADFQGRIRSFRKDRLERLPHLFREKVRRGYRHLAKRYPNICWVDGRGSVSQVHREILDHVLKKLHEKS